LISNINRNYSINLVEIVSLDVALKVTIIMIVITNCQLKGNGDISLMSQHP